jgi:hypothetical protein
MPPLGPIFNMLCKDLVAVAVVVAVGICVGYVVKFVLVDLGHRMLRRTQVNCWKFLTVFKTIINFGTDTD